MVGSNWFTSVTVIVSCMSVYKIFSVTVVYGSLQDLKMKNHKPRTRMDNLAKQTWVILVVMGG